MLLLNCMRLVIACSPITYFYAHGADADSIPGPCGINLAVDSAGNFINNQTKQVHQQLSNGAQTDAQFRFSNPNEKGFTLFFQALTHLTNLNLGYNDSVTKERNHNTLYIQALSELLKKTTALTKIELYSNNLDDSGASFLAEGLKQNSSLKTLDLNLNDITNKGALYLSDALKNNTALVKLDLEANTKIRPSELHIDPRIVLESNQLS
jgi:hypothetical protein